MISLESYLNNILTPKISSCRISPENIELIISDIRKRLNSIINHWKDNEFKRSLLITGIEEGNFYKPVINLEKRALVVLGVRNSLLEDFHSTDKKSLRNFNLDRPLISDVEMKEITQQAIIFFNDVNISKLSEELPLINNDPYVQLKEKYPYAWRAFNYLGYLSQIDHHYSSLPSVDRVALRRDLLLEENIRTDVQSGMDPSMSPNLIEILNAIVQGEIKVFHVDSFKALTRNPDKLFNVIEIVLKSGAAFVTSNFYLRDGYVARRKKFIKPGHNIIDFRSNARDLKGLTNEHAIALKTVLGQQYSVK